MGYWGVRAALLFAVLCAFALVLAGCPFASDQPLSDPATASVDQALLGAWTAKDPETGETHTITFLAFDDHAMIGLTPADPGKGTDAYRVVATQVGAETFLSAQELGTGDAHWTLLRYQFQGRTLVLTPVDDNLFGDRSFSSPAELRSLVLANLQNPRLYAAQGETRQDMVLQRAGK